MIHLRRSFVAATVGIALGLAGAAYAQTAPANASAAAAGAYTIDASHTAVIARVPHGNFSYEIFRFGGVAGQLTWNPANASANQLDVTIQTASIQTPVEGFAAELQGARFLNTAQFPQATFTSTAFRQIDATHAEVDGTLTLKGVANAVTFHVELIGAGPGQRGGAVIGYHATTRINNADYSFPGFIRGESEIVVDGEFNRQ